MISKHKIFAIPGSTRQQSSNLNLLHAIAGLFSEKLEIIIFDGLSTIPPFNPGDADDDIPKQVINFKQQIQHADGVLICTPEYAHGVPGTLKNAIDWTVSSNEFSKKPTALITASTDGRFGHQALLETLRVIEAENIDECQLLIPFIKTKVDQNNKIKDDKTLTDVLKIMNSLAATIEKQKDAAFGSSTTNLT